MTGPLTLPTSVIKVSGAINGNIWRAISAITPIGTQSTTKSAPSTTLERSVEAQSAIPLSRMISRGSSRLAQIATRVSGLFFRRAIAIDPPRSPGPMMATLFIQMPFSSGAQAISFRGRNTSGKSALAATARIQAATPLLALRALRNRDQENLARIRIFNFGSGRESPDVDITRPRRIRTGDKSRLTLNRFPVRIILLIPRRRVAWRFTLRWRRRRRHLSFRRRSGWLIRGGILRWSRSGFWNNLGRFIFHAVESVTMRAWFRVVL